MDALSTERHILGYCHRGARGYAKGHWRRFEERVEFIDIDYILLSEQSFWILGRDRKCRRLEPEALHLILSLLFVLYVLYEETVTEILNFIIQGSIPPLYSTDENVDDRVRLRENWEDEERGEWSCREWGLGSRSSRRKRPSQWLGLLDLTGTQKEVIDPTGEEWMVILIIKKPRNINETTSFRSTSSFCTIPTQEPESEREWHARRSPWILTQYEREGQLCCLCFTHENTSPRLFWLSERSWCRKSLGRTGVAALFIHYQHFWEVPRQWWTVCLWKLLSQGAW